LSGSREASPRSRRADAQRYSGRGKKKRGRLFSPAQRAVLLAALCGVVLCLAFFLVSSARLADQTRLMEEEQAAYDRRVWRTTVRYREQIVREAQQYGLRPAFVAAIILNESSYDPSAVSSVGARGLMQLLPDTGKWVAGKLGILDYTDDLLFDAETNLRLGVWYLDFLSDRYGGDPVLVACAYHAGHGNVDTWLTRYSRDGRTLSLDEIPMENTRSYARKVVDSYAIYLENYYQD
jgi:soluble lytic murein transglycosylase